MMKKYKGILSGLLILTLIIIFWPSSNEKTSGRIEDIHIAKAQQPIGPIFGKNEINQIFTSNLDHLAEVQILFATWARENSGSLFLKISEVGGEVFYSETIDMARMRDNSFISFKFDPRKNSKNKKYLINLSSPDSNANNNVTCWGMRDDIPEGFELTYNSQKTDLVLVFNTYTA